MVESSETRKRLASHATRPALFLFTTGTTGITGIDQDRAGTARTNFSKNPAKNRNIFSKKRYILSQK
jgi:hypothetical protein